MARFQLMCHQGGGWSVAGSCTVLVLLVRCSRQTPSHSERKFEGCTGPPNVLKRKRTASGGILCLRFKIGYAILSAQGTALCNRAVAAAWGRSVRFRKELKRCSGIERRSGILYTWTGSGKIIRTSMYRYIPVRTGTCQYMLVRTGTFLE